MKQVHLVSEDDYAADTEADTGLATAKSTLRSAACCAWPRRVAGRGRGVGDGVGGQVNLRCVCVFVCVCVCCNDACMCRFVACVLVA